jgi:hypothetical protein
MTVKLYQEIVGLIGQIVIFSPVFKQEILFNLRGLEPERLPHLAELLREVVAYQDEEIKKLLAKQPNFIAEQKTKQQKARLETVKFWSETVRAKDSGKINTLIQKIKNFK